MGMKAGRFVAAAVFAAVTLAGTPGPAEAQEPQPSKQEIMAFVEAARAEMRASRETARDLIDRSVRHRRKPHKLEGSYVGKFGKVLPPVKLMRFLQIDDRIDTLVELEVQRGIPIVETKD